MILVLVIICCLGNGLLAEERNETISLKRSKVPSCKRILEVREILTKLILEEELIPDSVRFAFHSCIGDCNGCINLDQADNEGLQTVYEKLEEFYFQNDLNAEGISRADIWSMAGLLAANAAIDDHSGSEKPCFDFHWGRKDCDTTPVTFEVFEFPQPTMNSTEMFDYFKKTFNFDNLETVAVMGAHSLGKATREHAGFDGVWTPGQETSFNVTYYENMITKNLTYTNVDSTADQANATGPHWQWEAVQPDGQTSMMFNTDFEIFFDVELDQTGKATCKLEPSCVEDGTCGMDNRCRKADTFEQGLNYIEDPQRFFTDFKNAYIKMLQTGAPDLVAKGSTCACQEEV